MKFLYFIIISVCPLAGYTQASRDLKGRILDAQTTEPVGFATIQTLHQAGGAMSDSAGFFMIKTATGTAPAELKITMLGYEPQVVRLSAGAPETVIRLEPTGGGLQEVVVTGTMKEMSKSSSPVPVEVFSPKFFLRNPTPSLFDAVQMINGVRPQLQCAVCNTGDIHINGMEGPYTMVLLDGMPIVSGLSTVYGLSGIPNSVLQRLEVVKGPAASLYGSEAMGGLINVITKDPPVSPQINLDVNGTTYGEYNVDAAGSARIGKVRTLLSANYFQFQNRFDINDDQFTDVTLARRVSVFNKWGFERKNNRMANLAARYIWENRFGGELAWTPEWRGTDSIYGESIYTRRYEILGNYQLPFNREKMVFSFSFNRHFQDSYYGTVPYLADQQIAFGQLTWDRKAGKYHQLLLGTSVRHTIYDDNTPVTADGTGEINRPQRIFLPGVFVQDEWTFSASWKLLSGLRLDYDRRHGAIVSPRINLKYAWDQYNTLRFSAGSGFRVANVFSEDHAALTGGREVVFAEALDPERSWNTNVNYTRFQSTNFGFVNLDMTAFYTRFFNKIVADYDTDPEKIIYSNLDGFAENIGFSLNSDWNFKNGLKIIAGFTTMEVHLIENGIKTWQIQTPRMTGNWQVSLPLPQWRLTLDYNGYVTSPMRLPVFPNDYRPGLSPWFTIHNIQVTWKARKNGVEIYGGVKNLLNFYPREDVIMRPFDPFDKNVQDPVNNPNGYTFDPSYNYAPVQGIRGFLGIRCQIKP